MILKKKKIVIIIILIILLFSFLLGWAVIKAVKVYKLKMDNVGQEIVAKDVFSASGKVLSVDAKNGFLIMALSGSQKELKVFVSADVNLTKLDPPSDIAEGTVFIYEEAKMKISDLKAGDEIFVQSEENIFGKEEIRNIESINLYK
jgi:hypothetical protein